MEVTTLLDTGVSVLLPILVIIGLVAIVFWAIKKSSDRHGKKPH